jgi:DNA mismatch repair protein MutS
VRGALLAQYLRIKAQHPDAVLLFRLGDFYEMFFDDAREASRALDLTLTARNRGEPDEVPLCGFPAHAAQPYVTRLLAAGRAVAICEQGEPERGKKLLERAVVRVITPGTILEEESLDPGAPSLLAALAYGA